MLLLKRIDFVWSESMFTVYALYSSKHDKIYIGYTSDIEQRMKSHTVLANKGWTVKYRPWMLVYYEEFPTKKKLC